MTDLTVRLTDAQAEQLAREAQKLGVTPQELLRAAVLDLIEGRVSNEWVEPRHIHVWRGSQ